MLKKIAVLIAVLVMGVLSEENELLGLKINGWGWIAFGRVGSGIDLPGTEYDLDFSKMWLSDVNAGLRIEKEFEENFKACVHLGISTAYKLTDPGMPSQEFQLRRFAPYIIEASLRRGFSFGERHSLKLAIGYLPVRYNPQAANLGEYLFRSTPYPSVFESGFELADKEKVTGLHAGYSMKLLDKSLLNIDEYLFSNMKIFPNFDISEALLASFNFQQYIEIGGGVCAHGMISVDKRKTTPGFDPQRISYYPEQYILIEGNDTTFYTFRGTKLMGRFTLNPQGFFKSSLFGPEDLKIYGEVALLGVKNYKGWFENRRERVPRMIGFNFPAFKVLDVLSLQLQYFPNPYYNTWDNVWKNGTPIPYTGVRYSRPYEEWKADTSLLIDNDDWKWSIYMSRKIGKRLRLSLLFANDDTKKTSYMPPPPAQSRYIDMMGQTWMEDEKGNERFGIVKDWYWMAKMMFYL
ncbi:MAG: hypothetical protein JW863_03125 [Chitinispirillaceae bacterium]|nr:hypothetical protein [Chitinispirillaceae bacterium]